MILADEKHTDVAAAARSLAETLSKAGSPVLGEELLICVDDDIAAGKPLKTLAVHDNRLYYGRKSLGLLP